MSVLSVIGKWVGIALGTVLILVGLPILAIGMLPGAEYLASLRELIVEASYVLTSFDQLGVPVDVPELVDAPDHVLRLGSHAHGAASVARVGRMPLLAARDGSGRLSRGGRPTCSRYAGEGVL